MSAARPKPLVIPQRGVIKGGMCNGWQYLFLRFEVVPVDIGWGVPIGHVLRVRARISAPNWPFPHDGLLTAAHFGSFRPVAGDRAKRLPADQLIEQAYGWAKVPMPAWGERHRTIRARVLRSGNTRKARQ
jgi:hypothetical protein